MGNFTGSSFKTPQTGENDPPCGIIGDTGTRFEMQSGSKFYLDARTTIGDTVSTEISGSIVCTNGFIGRSLTVYGDSMFDGATFNVSDGSLKLRGATKSHQFSGVQVLAGTLDIGDGTTVNLAGTNTIDTVFKQTNGKFTGTGTLLIKDTAEVADGSWDSITVLVAANAGLSFKKSADNINAEFTVKSAAVTNEGTITFNRPQTIRFVQTSSLTNSAVGVIDVPVDTTLAVTATADVRPTFSNLGTLTVGIPNLENGASKLEVAFPVTNGGTVVLTEKSEFKVTGDGNNLTYNYTQTAGTSKLALESKITASKDITISSGTVELGSGSQLIGSKNTANSGATVSVLGGNARLGGEKTSNAGTIALAKTETILVVGGDYTQTENGVLKIVVATGNKASLVDVKGTATLKGTVDGFPKDVIGANEKFKFMEFVNKMGTFDKLTTADAMLKKYNFKYNADNAELVPNCDPVGLDDSAIANEDTPVTISVLTNDTDAEGDTLATVSATNGTNGTTTINADGTVTYTPNPNWSGSDSFEYTIDDGFGGIATALVSVTVAPVNDAPVSVTGWATTQEVTFVDVDLRALVTDIETISADMTFAILDAVNGAVELLSDGFTARFTPASGYNGAASFNFTAADIGDEASPAITSAQTVTISVNSAPITTDVTYLSSGELFVYGTTNADTIVISAVTGGVSVILNGTNLGTFAPTTSIRVFGGEGNDTITLDSAITLSAMIQGEGGNDTIVGGSGDDVIYGGLGNDSINGGVGDDIVYGGAGNDSIDGGAGADILLGGEGDDLLIGGAGYDLMIGGFGADTLTGNASDDILIGGYTNYDGNETALEAIRTTWNTSGTEQERVAAIQATDFAYRLVADTVHDDAVNV